MSTSDPRQFLTDTFPALFAKGVEELRAKAAAGDAAAKMRLADVEGASGGVLLRVEGEGDVFLVLEEGGRMKTADAAENVRLAIAAPGPALRTLLGEAEASGELADAQAGHRAVGTASKALQDALGDESLLFHVIAEGVPELGTVTVKIGLNATEPPETPTFTATMAFDDLEAARNGQTNAQELFMGGKLKMAGDYSRALQIGMQVLQLQSQMQG
ncbi:MAG: SCP2 sterol-binding domain-containing protein [Myxococcota bacterium]